VWWGTGDLTGRYDCTEEQAADWLEKEEQHLSEACCMAGWSYIEEWCPFPALEDDEGEEYETEGYEEEHEEEDHD
jgi:hypothetical protein